MGNQQWCSVRYSCNRALTENEFKASRMFFRNVFSVHINTLQKRCWLWYEKTQSLGFHFRQRFWMYAFLFKNACFLTLTRFETLTVVIYHPAWLSRWCSRYHARLVCGGMRFRINRAGATKFFFISETCVESCW